mgnify:CR=1 FL=1
MEKHHVHIGMITIVILLFMIGLTCSILTEVYKSNIYYGTISNYYKISKDEYCINVEYLKKENNYDNYECTLFNNSGIIYEKINILEENYAINDSINIRLRKNKNHCEIYEINKSLYFCMNITITLVVMVIKLTMYIKYR